MAEVTITGIVNLRITDAEWRLIMKSLAAFAGLPIKPAKEEKSRAEALNKQLLNQRVTELKDQLLVAEGALKRAEDGVNEPDEGHP
jgi:hypothetical protein